MQNAATGPHSSRSWLSMLHLRSQRPSQRIAYEAQLAIPEDRVVDALAALIHNHRGCRGYAIRSDHDPHRHLVTARKSLMDALNHLGHEATRATDDIGVRIVYGAGDAAAVRTVLNTLEPFVTVHQPVTWQSGGIDVSVTGHGQPARSAATLN